MNVPTRLALFAAVLGLAFGGAALAGAAIDPTGEEPATADHAAMGGKQPAAEEGAGGGEALSGLAVSDRGYSLEIDRSLLTTGDTAPFTFRITDPGGGAVRGGYEVVHEKELHLIVVRRDTAIFRHLHPGRDKDGTWSVDMTLGEPGAYRAYADFTIGGVRRTLATDLFVPGDFQPQPLPAPRPTAQTVDTSGKPAGDLDVTLEAPGVRAGSATTANFAVTQRGRPFGLLEPYLGAKGHLVALREGDLAYLHVHPVESGMDMDGNGSMDMEGTADEIAFAATFPTAARYRLFLQFKTGGEIRTVSYTLEVPR